MPSPRVIDERVLAPISAARPAGEDLSPTADWVAIRKARPNINDTAEKGDWEPADPGKSDWTVLKQAAETALCTKTKDLRLAIWLTEASIRLSGFAGIRDGVGAIRRLLTDFWDSGLYPQVEDGDLEMRSGPLEWLNEKLAELIREIPITLRPSPGKNYSLNYRKESLRQGGAIGPDEFETAVSAGSFEQYQQLGDDLREARAEFAEFEQLVNQKFGPAALSFSEAKSAFDEVQGVIHGIIRKKRPVATDSGEGGNGHATRSRVGVWLGEAPSAGAWRDAEDMVRSGDVDGALAAMAGLAAAEPNGRIRFQRKLLLADICMQTGRPRLAKSILEELAELIEKHHLDEWETSEVIGAVWTRLYRCYSDEATGTADPERASALFLKLCRLDPWQALACGEGSH